MESAQLPSTTRTHSAKSSGRDPERLLRAFFEVRHIRLSADALRMWIDALSDLTIDQLTEAIRRFNRESNDFPTPAAVRKFAGDGEAGIDDRAIVAWAIVRREIGRTGAYESVEFDDPLINAAIRSMGGWELLCGTETDQMVWREKDFKAAYMAVLRTGMGDGGALTGICERENARNGFETPPPKRIETGLSQHPIAARLTCSRRMAPRLQAVRDLSRRLTVDHDTRGQ